ncbi:ATP-binding protein, partial [Planctomycetota bacterium]
DANDSLQSEADRRTLIEERLIDVQQRIESEVQKRVKRLRSTNEQLVQEVSACRYEGEHQSALVTQMEQANRELKEFAYVVSHDLKAPLRGIKNLAGWIAEDYAPALGDEGRAQLDLLLGRVERMEQLIEGILQYSRLGRVVNQDESVDLNELLTGVIDMVAPPTSIQVVVETPLPALVGDRTRITQVFQNLVSNAIKYMDKPEGKVTIACTEEDDRWVFRCSDNGPGIEAEYFEKIFKMFQTLASHDEIESSGIGLAVVRKVVSMYGGQVWVESTVGKGSTFFFSWPRCSTANHLGGSNEQTI